MKSLRGLKRFFPTRKSIFTPFLIALLALLGACTSQQNREAGEVPSDEEITRAIQTQFEEDPALTNTDITVETTDGIVSLSGETDNLLAKTRAEKLTEEIRGVVSVINNIKITASRPDETLQRDVNRALATDPITEEWQITASANNGAVMLKGVVESWQEKQLAFRIARGVKGVKEVKNALIVEFNETRTDREIKTEVERGLMLDSRLRGGMIDVTVSDGKVSLSGAVGSASEKRLARELAHVTGVNSVEVDELEIHPEYESSMFRSGAVTDLTEAEILNAVQRALRYDPRVTADSITVDVDGNGVTLTGNVEYLNAKLAAGNDARNTAGVRTVTNNINVQHKVVVSPEVATTDKAVRTRAREALARDPYIDDPRSISIDVRKGVVELTGEVRSTFLKQQAEKVVGNVKGVIGIDNELTVQENG